MLTADFNGDGAADLAINGIDDSGNRVVTALFQRHGQLTTPRMLGGALLGVGDLNGDRRDDVLTRSDRRAARTWLSRKGDKFAVGKSIELVKTQTGWLNKISLADLDGNGLNDLIVVGDDVIPDPNTIRAQVVTYLAVRDGSYRQTDAYVSEDGGLQLWMSADAADMDLDGDLDLLISAKFFQKIKFNTGQGTFGSPALLSVISLAPEIIAAEMTGDDRIDVLLYGNGFTLLHNLG